MKQPNFKRKALGMLMVPLTLGALPVNAMTLDATPYEGSGEFYEATDASNNRMFFYKSSDETDFWFIGAETSNSSITLPESLRIRVNDEWEEEAVYEELAVTKFRLSYDWDWIIPGLERASELTDITLTKNIESVDFLRCPGYKMVNVHFKTEDVPSTINVEGISVNHQLTSRTPFSVPATAVEAYKKALADMPCMVIAEGTDPKKAYDAEIAAIDGVPVTEDSDCVPYASWSYTDDKGTLYAFESPWYDNVTFRGTITKEKAITIPPYVYLTDPEYYALRAVPVTRFCLDYYNEENNGFPGSVNLTDIYVPSHLTHAEFHGEGFDSRMNFHFTSQEVPEFWLNNGSSNYVNIYVPDELFTTYADALGDQDYILWSETPATPVNVNVATPGTLAEQISAVTDNLSNVRWLVVTGTPNEIDLRMIRRLSRLEKLDLSNATGLTSVGSCNGLRYLQEVQLPNGITSIDNSAFYNCRRLPAIELPASVTRIGSNAFEYTSVASANLEKVEYISDAAFHGTRLTEVSLDAALEIGNDAFSDCRIEKVTFSPDVKRIGGAAFRNNRLSGTFVVPESLTSLEWETFAYNHDIKKVVIHNNVNYMNWTFQGIHPESVECSILFPTENPGFGDDMSSTTLYVPALTINEYMLHDNWLHFTNIEPLPYDLSDLKIDRDFTISSDKGIADKADLNLFEVAHLTVDRSKALYLGEFNMNGRYDGGYWDPNYGWRYGEYYAGATFIPESTVTADKININLRLRTNRWTFLSFPFDINVKDIVVEEDALWVVRKYSGEVRANLEENTWQNMTDETILKAGEGYIFNCAAENHDEVNFKITPAADGNALFAKDIVSKTLASYPSEFAHNASWNLVGNTYPAYLNLKGIDFDAPITVWQDNTYYAYSPLDDELVLDPFQAFFVQAQATGDVLKLNPAARAHSRQAAAELALASAARAPRTDAPRSLFNVYVKGENGSDRTRVVVNEEASAAYESNRDASKFMSSDELVPQIFVNNSGVRMAINEAPLGNGEFTIGTRFGKKGEYTISLDSRDAEAYSALLIDNLTGDITDLKLADYVFEADASLNDARFTLALASTNAVNTVVAEGLKVNVDGNVLNIRSNATVEITVASIDGKTIASALSADFSTNLENGIYIVKAGEKTMKVKVGK